ncbi:MAG: LptF/LptG family permease, partial [Betaproteobacteria bacterium]
MAHFRADQRIDTGAAGDSALACQSAHRPIVQPLRSAFHVHALQQLSQYRAELHRTRPAFAGGGTPLGPHHRGKRRDPAFQQASGGRRLAAATAARFPGVKTLNRYIGREVFFATLLIFVALLMLFAFFDLIHELANVGRDGYPLGRALLFVGLSLPGHVYELMPTAVLIGTLFAISQLVGNSEYTVMRTSGASLTQITVAILRIGVPLAIATFLAGEFLAPPAERLAQQVRVQTEGQATRIVAQQFQSGFWFKQDLTFANIRSVLADMSLLGVRIYEFDRDLRLRILRTADSGTFVADGQWKLRNVQTTELFADGAKVTRDENLTWDTVLKPSILTVYQVAP